MTSRATILIAARWPVGGIRTYLRYIFRYDVLADQRYVVLAPDAAGLDVALADFAAERVERMTPGQSNAAMFREGVRAARQRQPALIHSHGFTSALLLAPIARLARIPHLVTTHDVLFPAQFAGVKGWIKRLAVAAALRSADHVMAVGEEALTNLRSFFPALDTDTKSTAIRNGIEPSLFAGEQRRPLRQELSLAPGTTLLGFFGRFMAQKGFTYLVEAVARLRREGHDVQVACFGWGGFIREEQQALRERGLSEFFHFLAQTDDMVAALRGVDAVVIPSRWEACPLLPMEALVAGAPVITSDCIGMTEVVADTPALVFPTGDADALSQCIARIVARPEAYRDQAEAFRADASKRFDGARSAASLASLYADLMDQAD
jgi:glycosyltransferase involved in cell wall biosynthesis